ncbi:hypothetical protein [Methylogaea oryzae]|uniref:hypothetical protein n=1 Tax=Methylogaea oryzae TaxID=1295382 RepID=UPI00138F1334|nr:hypothetical protein [Methylogaea oryzae]
MLTLRHAARPYLWPEPAPLGAAEQAALAKKLQPAFQHKLQALHIAADLLTPALQRVYLPWRRG